ncbi:glycosyltransferase involved in cell wall biosynthesis [Cytobacillus eiseniae]|uniref:Glycosyltransferase involved in cell wall biosynthesis n=1 Tax=Cytobacillus eiseniae TaxID=762947 RepID=A0ABS4RG61_9BACI|nr:glycosyltransferase family 4 protein [Cytobacillus eiseniae]MBP2241866.1 glycosyltransferase involved in cell wall biosynthesis [Cytobacillus eiseniae]
MKILCVTTISSTVNAFLIPHIRSLLASGNEVGVACNLIKDVDPEIRRLGCSVHEIEFQRSPIKMENIRAYKRIKKIVLEEGYEIIHVHTPVASFLTRLACRRLNVKVLYTAHGFHFFQGAPRKNWFIYYPIEKIAAKWTDSLITMNDEDYLSARNLKLRKEESIFKVSGVGIDLEKFIPQTTERKQALREEYQYKKDDFIIIYIGELSYRKHQDHLIKAISLVKGKIENVRLLLVGDGGFEEQYKRLVQTLNIEGYVDFLGYRKDIHHLLALADLAVSTSRQEGLPVNIMEAMATGLPIIVTNCRGNRDLIVDEENGFIVGIDDIEACANAIETLYQSDELRTRFAKKSKERIHLFSEEAVLKEMREIYASYLR